MAVAFYASRRVTELHVTKYFPFLAQNDAFVFYSGHTEEHLITGHNFIIEKLLEQSFEKQYVSRKYANKKFLKASVFAMEWARLNGITTSSSESSSDEMMLEA